MAPSWISMSMSTFSKSQKAFLLALDPLRQNQVMFLIVIIIIIIIIIIINNYWMRLSMISWIIKTEVCVICRSRRLRQITQTRGFDNSWYHAKTEFNNCFIIHFSHNSSSETEAKHSALTSGRRHGTLSKRTPQNKPIVFIVFLVLLSFCSCVFYKK